MSDDEERIEIPPVTRYVKPAIPRQPDQHGGFNERRNTSRVFPPEHGALAAALKALRSVDPRLRKWIEDGHPTLTEDEHYKRFGETYAATRPKKKGAE